MISRRLFLSVAGCMALPRIAGAQPIKTMPRVACIGPPTSPPVVEFISGLRELGYVDGVTMRLETRWAPAEDRPHLNQLAKELVTPRTPSSRLGPAPDLPVVIDRGTLSSGFALGVPLCRRPRSGW